MRHMSTQLSWILLPLDSYMMQAIYKFSDMRERGIQNVTSIALLRQVPR
jgi:hypothetical protein